tara:strand:+ start:10059 stop:10226 length:168 start_codon:yes stop_codon:yes gene_type:complete
MSAQQKLNIFPSNIFGSKNLIPVKLHFKKQQNNVIFAIIFQDGVTFCRAERRKNV